MEGLPVLAVASRRAAACLMSQMRRVVLLRHGRTEWNATGRFQGQLDAPLDGIGRAQAEAAGDRGRARCSQMLWSAPTCHARMDTAAAVGAECGLEVEASTLGCVRSTSVRGKG